jgi:hypothetical protein
MTTTTHPTSVLNRSLLKRNAVRQKLLTYHLRFTPTTVPIQLTTPLPQYDLIDSWGHSLPAIDPSTTFRVFLQNPNGLSLMYKALSLRNDLTTCKQYGSAITSLPETNVNWNRSELYTSFKSAVLQTWLHSVLTASRSPEDFLSHFQLGGPS